MLISTQYILYSLLATSAHAAGGIHRQRIVKRDTEYGRNKECRSRATFDIDFSSKDCDRCGSSGNGYLRETTCPSDDLCVVHSVASAPCTGEHSVRKFIIHRMNVRNVTEVHVYTPDKSIWRTNSDAFDVTKRVIETDELSVDIRAPDANMSAFVQMKIDAVCCRGSAEATTPSFDDTDTE